MNIRVVTWVSEFSLHPLTYSGWKNVMVHHFTGMFRTVFYYFISSNWSPGKIRVSSGRVWRDTTGCTILSWKGRPCYSSSKQSLHLALWVLVLPSVVYALFFSPSASLLSSRSSTRLHAVTVKWSPAAAASKPVLLGWHVRHGSGTYSRPYNCPTFKVNANRIEGKQR